MRGREKAPKSESPRRGRPEALAATLVSRGSSVCMKARKPVRMRVRVCVGGVGVMSIGEVMLTREQALGQVNPPNPHLWD